jgi:biopolymer transport protein TolR
MAFGSESSTTRQRTPTALAEINVTPLVDVMLVLLIVFMISAPLMQQGVQVDLPKVNAGSLSETPEQIVVVIQRNQTIEMNGNKIPVGSLRSRLAALATANPNIEIAIKADQGVPYGVVARVMGEIKSAKIHKVGLVTEPGQSESP